MATTYKTRTTTIRGLNQEFYQLAKSHAIMEEKQMGQWMNEAIKEKLARDTAYLRLDALHEYKID